MKIGANQKTTIMGIIAGAVLILQETYNLLLLHQHVNWGLVGFAIAIMALGKVCKDWDTTGGTVPSVPIPADMTPVMSMAPIVAPKVALPTIANPTGVIPAVQPTTTTVVADKPEVKP